MPLTNEQRAALTNETMGWVGTRYRGWSAVKGPKGGVDCGMLVKAVYQNCGFVQGDLKIDMTYSLDVARHMADSKYIDKIEEFMREIPQEEVLPGDVMLFKIGLAFAHAAIIVQWPLAVHALAHGGVKCTNGVSHPLLKKAVHKFYTLKEEYCHMITGKAG